METKRELIIKQIELMGDIRRNSDINIVTCGHCGTVLLHKTEQEEIRCFDCGSLLDISDCPDLYYSGIENNQEFNDTTTI